MEGLLIPLFGIVFTFSAPVLIVWLALAAHSRKKALLHESINKLVDSGQPVPLELINSLEQRKPASMLQNGVILIATAVGLVCFLLTLTNIKIASVAAIPFCIGVAFVLLWKMEQIAAARDAE